MQSAPITRASLKQKKNTLVVQRLLGVMEASIFAGFFFAVDEEVRRDHILKNAVHVVLFIIVGVLEATSGVLAARDLYKHYRHSRSDQRHQLAPPVRRSLSIDVVKVGVIVTAIIGGVAHVDDDFFVENEWTTRLFLISLSLILLNSFSRFVGNARALCEQPQERHDSTAAPPRVGAADGSVGPDQGLIEKLNPAQTAAVARATNLTNLPLELMLMLSHSIAFWAVCRLFLQPTYPDVDIACNVGGVFLVANALTQLGLGTVGLDFGYIPYRAIQSPSTPPTLG